MTEDVTERVEAVRALRESELRTRLAQEAAKAGTWELRLADNRSQWSENTWRLYGLKPGQCTPSFDAWASSIHVQDRESVKKALRDAIATGGEYEVQWRVNLREGEPERWLFSRGQPITGANGEPERYIGVVIDITERKRMEEALRESELRMRLAQEAAKAGTWEWRLAENRDEWSESAWALYGLKPGQCQPSFEAWVSSIHAQDRERIVKTARDAAAAGREYEIQWRVNLPEGEPTRWLFSRGRPIAGANGEPERYIGVVIDITERKRMEQALRKAEKLERQKREELETILAAIPAAVVIAKDAACIEMAGNRSAYDLLRLGPHQDLSKSAPLERAPKNFEVFANGRRLPPDEMPIQRAAASKTAIIGEELEVRFVEGDRKFVLANALPLFDDKGQVRGAVGAFADVTELKRTEAALRESEKLERQERQELEAILAAIPAPVLIAKDASCEDMTGNPAAYELYRVPPGTNISKSAPVGKAPANFEIFQNGRHLQQEQLPIRKAAASRLFSREEIELRFVDGDSKYLLGNALPLFNEAGEVRGAVAAFADVTELKRTEAALRESKERLKFALDAANAGAWEVEPETGKLAASDRALSFLGIAPGTPVTHETALARVHPDDRSRLDEGLRHAGAKGAPFELEWRVLLPDGSIRWLEGRGERRFASGKQVVAGLVQDITERKRNEEALASARRLEAVGQLAGGVAHDFNNLLAVIAGNLELAEDRITDEITRDLLQRSLNAAEKGRGLNRRLLSLARKRTLKPERLSLNSRVEETAKLLACTLGEHIAVTTDLARSPWMTLADPCEIDSAILNIAANARDAMPNGGEITIATSNVKLDAKAAAEFHSDAHPGEYVCLTIADDGAGMPIEVLRRAMEPFFTTKGHGIGTGLGLTSVANFAKQSGGFAIIKSAPDHGCAVSLYLPRFVKTLTARENTPGEVPLGNGERVLVVEDNDDVREVTLRRIESLGYVVTEARTGPEALQLLLSEERVRLVLSDIVMPGGMSGYDVAHWLASNKPEVKVILCSGYTEADRCGELPDPIRDIPVLGKPFTREQLADALSRALAGRDHTFDRT